MAVADSAAKVLGLGIVPGSDLEPADAIMSRAALRPSAEDVEPMGKAATPAIYIKRSELVFGVLHCKEEAHVPVELVMACNWAYPPTACSGVQNLVVVDWAG